jgi:hypothetical protein
VGPVKHPAFTVHDTYEHFVRFQEMTGRTVQRPILLIPAARAAKPCHTSSSYIRSMNREQLVGNPTRRLAYANLSEWRRILQP